MSPREHDEAVLRAHRILWPEQHMAREQAAAGGWYSQWSADTLDALAEVLPRDMFDLRGQS